MKNETLVDVLQNIVSEMTVEEFKELIKKVDEEDLWVSGGGIDPINDLYDRDGVIGTFTEEDAKLYLDAFVKE